MITLNVRRIDNDAVQAIGFSVEPQKDDVITLNVGDFIGEFLVLRRDFSTSKRLGPTCASVTTVVLAPIIEREEVVKVDPNRDEWQLILDGSTEDDTAIKAWWRPGRGGIGMYKVEVDETPVTVARADIHRDGGTKVLQLTHPEGGAWPPDGYKLIFPHRLGSDDRTPRFAGKRVE
jgi:hypothetical protein